ncbi:MAG: hypothetical protein QOG13_988 [Sphingomonadales bacterium]|jgi:hypothetical protein|nr:hypothetical protein [Sphingomonadales bacterium]
MKKLLSVALFVLASCGEASAPPAPPAPRPAQARVPPTDTEIEMACNQAEYRVTEEMRKQLGPEDYVDPTFERIAARRSSCTLTAPSEAACAFEVAREPTLYEVPRPRLDWIPRRGRFRFVRRLGGPVWHTEMSECGTERPQRPAAG